MRLTKLHYIGKINKNKLGIFKNKIIDENIILTEKRRIHIYKNHKKDYEEIINNLDRTVLNPNEILLDSKNKNTIFLIGKIKKHNLNVVVRLNVDGNIKHFQNSVMTAWIIREKNLQKLREKNKSIYKSE